MDTRSSVLRVIALKGPISRAQIARHLSLSGPSVTIATKDLISQGIIQEFDRVASGGGRPLTLLKLVGEAAMVMGVKLAPDHLVGLHVDLEGNPLHKFEAEFKNKGEAAIRELIEILRNNLPDSSVPLIGIGLGIPGVIAPDDFGTTESALMDWHQIPLAEILTEALNTPVIIDNDVNTLAVAETLVDREIPAKNFLVLTVGRGIGLGIVTNSQVYRGSFGAAELGHVSIESSGPVCECGKNGCLEAFAGDPALLRLGQEAGLVPPAHSVKDLAEQARNGNASAEAVFRQAAMRLGQAVGNLVNILGPELIIVSGEGTQNWDLWQSDFEKHLYKNAVSPFDKVTIEIDHWGDDRWAQGAASLVLRAGLAPHLSDSSNDSLVRQRLAATGNGAA